MNCIAAQFFNFAKINPSINMRSNVFKFYTKNLSAFVGYARRQASKYGIKGSRLNSAEEVIKFLTMCNKENRLADYWKSLPRGEHIHFVEFGLKDNIPLYQVCGKKFQNTAKAGYVLEVMNKFFEAYGARAKQAAENKGIDWKAISHAFRAAYQVKQLLTENTITFPLKEADFLKKVKAGELDYNTEASVELERLMDEVEKLSEESILPEKVNHKFWDKFIIEEVEKTLL